MTHWKRWIATGCLVVSMCALSGCLAVAAAAGAAGGVAYAMGDLEAVVEANPPDVVEATERAFNDLKRVKVSAESSSLDGEVIARTAADKKVTVKVRKQTEKVSKLSIRVGTFGDEAFSRMIYDKIKEHL